MRPEGHFVSCSENAGGTWLHGSWALSIRPLYVPRRLEVQMISATLHVSVKAVRRLLDHIPLSRGGC